MQQAQQAMIEKIHERRANPALLGLLVSQAIQVITGQRRVGAVQAKEAGLQAITHFFAILLNACRRDDVGGRKAQSRMALQAHTTARRGSQGPGFQVIAVQGVQMLQQTVKRIVPRVGQQHIG
ncbi:hypothetical protein D3C87_1344100 [compost metagenome]